MKILALTTAKNLRPATVARWRADLNMGSDIELTILTVHPPRKHLRGVRVECVDPSVLPWRPIVPVQGARTQNWKGTARATTRSLRLVRRTRAALHVPTFSKESTHLAIACATSGLVRELADAHDLVVAMNDGAALGAWQLARRSPGPVVVHGPANVRTTLQRLGHPVPPQVVTDAAAEGQSVDVTEHSFPESPGLADATGNVLIAPANYAGQAQAWSEALRTHSTATGMNLRVGNPLRNPFPTDLEVDLETFQDLNWRLAWRDFVRDSFTHVILEANRPLLGHVQSGFGDRHAGELIRAGKTVALLSHGSDARIPSVHSAQEKWHSYAALPPKTLHELEVRALRNVEVYNNFEGTVFISTPALRTFIPAAVWLPLVIDADRWHNEQDVFRNDGLPVVAHIPSSAQKGSHLIDPILQGMADAGLIRYLRVENIPHDEMPALYQSADIVVEQFGIADYSAAACEAMAAGRVVVSRVAEHARALVQAETGRTLPVVEANPETLRQVVLDIAADPERAREIGGLGREFVRQVHDGRRSAQILKDWMDRA